jgi:hypothetical protein
MSDERMLSIGETSRLLGVDPRQVLALGDDGALDVRTVDGRGWVVAASAERLVGKLPRMVARQRTYTRIELR